MAALLRHRHPLREWAFLWALGAMLTAAGAAASAADKAPWHTDWFEPALDPKVLKEYEAQTVDVGWSEGRTYVHRVEEGRRSQPKFIVAVLPKESGSYPKSFSRLLAYMAGRFPGSRLTVFNFGKKDENGLAVLKYAKENKADLIFTIGSESATLAAKHFVGCGIPVVTCNNKDPVLSGLLKNAQEGSGTNIAFTTVNMPVEELYQWTKKFRPSLKVVTLVFDSEHKEVGKTEVTPLRELFADKGVKVLEAPTKVKTTEEDLQRVIPQTLAQMREIDSELDESMYIVTSCTNLWEQPGLGQLAGLAGECPVLATIPDAVNGRADGALISIGLDRGNAAHLAAVYAGRILSGRAKPGEMPLGWVTPPDIAVSFLKAREIKATIPFEIFENASFIYDYDGNLVMRDEGEKNPAAGETGR